MARSRDKQRANSREKTRERKKKKMMEEQMSTTTNGYTDLTPYNAIMGTDKISKATLSEVKTKVNGSFNG